MFFVYFACRYQTDSRRRELGMYLMLGMKRSRLFGMLFGETLWNSMISLIIGIPVALFLTEGISLASAKIVGLGIIGHRFSLSPDAILWTVCGFVLVQLFYIVVLAVFIFGILGTFLLYRGLGGFLGLHIRRKAPGAAGLQTFTARQVQENVLSQHRALAVSSLLLMTALACISYGIAMGMIRSASSRSVDFSLFGEEAQIHAVLARDDISEMVEDSYPLYLSLVKNGYFRDQEKAFDTGELEDALAGIAGTENIIENLHIDYVISESSYNHILAGVGKETIDLSGGKTALYSSLANDGDFGALIQNALNNDISIGIDGVDHELLPVLCYDNIVADRAITLYLGLIVPDELYTQLAREPEPYCQNVRLSDDEVEKSGLMQAVQKTDALLTACGIEYDSYLGGIGRNLFYTVAASYLTIYLGILFWLIANTVIGMSFPLTCIPGFDTYSIS